MPGQSLLCIEVDNYEARKYFNKPCAPTSAAGLELLVTQSDHVYDYNTVLGVEHTNLANAENVAPNLGATNLTSVYTVGGTMFVKSSNRVYSYSVPKAPTAPTAAPTTAAPSVSTPPSENADGDLNVTTSTTLTATQTSTTTTPEITKPTTTTTTDTRRINPNMPVPVAVGTFSLPRSINNGVCADQAPALYLTDASHVCKRLYRPALGSGGCPAPTEMKGLNAQSYFGFDVSKHNYLAKQLLVANDAVATEDASNDEAGESITVDSGDAADSSPSEPRWVPIECGSITNSSDCYNPSNTYVQNTHTAYTGADGTGAGSCANVVVGVKYVVEVKQAGSINKVAVAFEYQTFRGTTVPFYVEQTFSIAFVRPDHPEAEQSDDVTLVADRYPRSGNPGYIRGKPVLGGALRMAGFDATKLFVTLQDDPLTWLYFPKADSTGACPVVKDSGMPPSPRERMSVSYGYDATSSCVYELALANFKDCSAIRNKVYAAVKAITERVQYVGRYGMSSQTVIEDWVQVLNIEPPVPPESDGDGTPYQCSPVITGVHLELLTAKIGAQANPQETIVGARYIYSVSEVKFSCVGTFCMAGSAGETQKLSVGYSVAFVDVTEEASPVLARTPSIIEPQPYDFFYPFA